MKDYDLTPDPEHPRTVKDFDSEDQPREKAIRNGCSVLSNADLLAIILRTGTPGNPVTSLCRKLLNDNDGRLKTLERRTRKELLKIKGIGMTKAIQIEAVLELIRRYNSEGDNTRPILRSSRDIAEFMTPKIGNLPHEEIWVILLSQRFQVIRDIQISVGSATASIFDVKKIMKHALLEGAQAIAMAHNHPSGNLVPSSSDNAITHQLADACSTMSIRFVDHIIVTSSSDAYYSFHDNGRI